MAAVYRKSLQSNRNTFVVIDGEDTRTQTLQNVGDNLQCTTSDIPFTGELESSSQQEYEDVGDEILAFSRLGQRPSHSPS